jgi:hypothetical protein
VIDAFELYNPIEPGQRKSRLQHLNEIGATKEEWLIEAVDHLESVDGPYVAAFFQFPGAILVENAMLKLPAKTSGVKVQFVLHPFLLDVIPHGQLQITTSFDAANPNATQVMGYTSLWGRRAECYHRYTGCFNAGGMKNGIVMYSHEHGGGRTLLARDFEIDICKRLEDEFRYAIRRLLKSYATLVRAMHPETDVLYNFFMMTHPARLAYHSVPVPLLSYFLRAKSVLPTTPVEARRIERGVEFTYRRFSRFELQIFELNRLSREGNHALALVGALSLIEWVLKLVAPVRDKRLRLSELVDKLTKHGLSNSVSASLTELRKIRNEAAHLGEHAKLGNKRPHEVLELDIDSIIDEKVAGRAIDLAWSIFQQANAGSLIRR